MKEAIVSPDITVTIHDAPVPVPGPQELLVKVVVAGINPKDWKFPELFQLAHNTGDDMAGVVVAVGSDVNEFRVGDRVAGMHQPPKPHGAFAEYAILKESTAFHLPEDISFEEGATIPLVFMTALYGLFWVLELPLPWAKPPTQKTPLIIYGASTAVGAFAIKLAHAAGIHPIIAVGSSSSAFVSEYLDSEQGDVLVDYTAHPKPEDLVLAIQEAARKSGVPGGHVKHAFDAVGEAGTYDAILSTAMAVQQDAALSGQRPRISVVIPTGTFPTADPSVDVIATTCGLSHTGGEREIRFAAAGMRMVTRGLALGWLKSHPYEVVDGGLGGLEDALRRLKGKKVRGKKLVIRLADTEGVSQE